MKKGICVLLTGMMMFSLCPINQVKAVNFEGQEDQYMKICSSSNLNSSNYNTCKEFNTYLKKKNKELKQTVNNVSSELSTTENNLSVVSSKLTSLNNQIDEKEKEISYLQQSISQLESSIQKKENDLKDRMYAMQSYNNSNSYIEFIFGSQSFSDFFSRIDSVNELTQYDRELVSQLADEKKQVESQKSTIEVAKANIESQRQQQATLKNQYALLFQKQQEQLSAAKQASSANEKASSTLDSALTTFYQNSLKDDTSAGITPGSGDSETGIAIAKKALSMQGKRYWWGATGPDYFDCSGLVYWSMNAAGVKIGRTTAAGYAAMGKAVSYNQLQVGDVITFNYGSGVAHIGIYIGGGNMVHASGKGSETHGQDPNQCVKTTSIKPGTYFYSVIYNCRRLY
ncbi:MULTISPECIES: C40 family peptidase [Coprobacillaceae]|uniref:C40 family peptidase n=1 Tax=Coprobacillaceae TaxID=2810280 RepID=UPI000E52580A|nr:MULTISPECIES: C40 family peptidase [Coprobacillaceae]RHM59126.1 hypothetical protein DWZ53_10200 [Coprobacillus sp. AF33-1AC]RHS91787.1 hypothetical protein DW911_09565 [Erysipelatoclostridium sp. AM42-17]